VAEEVRQGRLRARRIVGEMIVRTLFLVRPAGARSFLHEAAIEDFMQRMVAKLTVAVGELGGDGRRRWSGRGSSSAAPRLSASILARCPGSMPSMAALRSARWRATSRPRPFS
jgi:hypothetical protein